MNRKEQKQAARKLALAEILQDMTQQTLADKVGTATSYISNLLHDERAISDDMADRIDAALGRVQGWMDIPRSPKQSKPTKIAQIHFQEDQLEILHKLLALPDDMRNPLVASIENGYRRMKPKPAKKRAKKEQT